MNGPRLAEQFESLPKQEHAMRLAMWLFLASEVLLFAGLFALYGGYRVLYPDGFALAEGHNTIAIGTINTYVLITSSLTVALALRAVEIGQPRAAVWLLVATMLLGLTFLGLKAGEYTIHIREGILPGSYFRHEGLPGFGPRMFYTLYYFMTGLHGLHVIGGLSALAWMTVRVHRGAYSPRHHLPLELVGLYWHLVDVVWIFLWPLFYRFSWAE